MSSTRRRHQPEVAGVDRQIGVADAPHQPIKQRRRAALEHGLALPLAAQPVDHIRFGAIHQPPHLAEEFRRILQIGVDGEDAVAAAGVEAGRHRQLMTVSAGKIDGHQMRIAPHQIGHDRPGPIARAVVQQDQFIVRASGVLRGRGHAPVKFLEPCLFIVARRNDREPRTGAPVGRHRHRQFSRPRSQTVCRCIVRLRCQSD